MGTTIKVLDRSERGELFRQTQVTLWATHMCANKEEWTSNWGNVLNVETVSVDQLRCFVDALGPDNTDRLFMVALRGDTPALEHFTASQNCGLDLERLLTKGTSQEPTPTLAPEPPITPAPAPQPTITSAPPAPTEGPSPSDETSDEEMSQSLSGLGDAPYLLHFWFPGCPPCEADMLLIDKLFEGGRWPGVELRGIQTQEVGTPAEGLALAKSLDISYPLVYDEDGHIYGDFGISSLPTTLVNNAVRTKLRKWEGTLSEEVLN